MYAPQDAILVSTVAFATVTRHKQRGCVRACKRKGGERKRERRKRKRERRIKYRIVGIEYGIEITRVQEKYI
jgi:hypothetical protein